MKLTNNGNGGKIWPAMLCGALSVFVDFVLIPQVCSPRVLGFSVPDPIWMSLMVLIPVMIAIFLVEQKAHLLPGYVWIGLPVQYLILIVFAGPLPRISGHDSWTYIWAAAVWPLGVTAAQFVSLAALRIRKVKRGKSY